MIKYKNLLLENILFSFLIIVANFIFCYFYIKLFPYIVDEKLNFNIHQIGFNFKEIIQNLQNKNSLTAEYFGETFYVSRMPLIPLTLVFLHSFISKNIFIIHLIKNLFFCLVIFNLAKKVFEKKYFYYSIFFIFIVPYNIIISFSFNFEEGLLNYLVIILLLTQLSSLKFKIIIISLLIVLLFFLKSSMFFLCLGFSLFYLFFYYKLRKKIYILPILFLLLSQIIWGAYSYNKTGKFVFGISSVSYNAFTLKHAYNKNFTSIYPSTSPDILSDQLEKLLPKNQYKDEWQINQFYFDSSIDYFKNNFSDVIYGVYKKFIVIFVYPYKDSQIPPDDGSQIKKEIRLSNIPSKLFFIYSIFILFTNLNTKKNIKIKRNIYFYFIFLIFYFFPYIVGFIYTRHCTSAYMISILFCIYAAQNGLKNSLFLNKFLTFCTSLLRRKVNLFKQLL